MKDDDDKEAEEKWEGTRVFQRAGRKGGRERKGRAGKEMNEGGKGKEASVEG